VHLQFENNTQMTMETPSQHQDVIFGIRPVIEAFEAGKQVDKLLILSTSGSTLTGELLRLAKLYAVPVQKVPMEKLNRITRKNHQGVIAFISPITYGSLEQLIPTLYEEGRSPFILVLDRVTDVRNFGALARTAEAAGVDAILIPSRGSVSVSGDAVKTSAGALHRIPVCREDNLKIALEFLKMSGLKIAAISEKSTETLWQANLKGPIALILGSEEDGISPEYLKKADVHLSIPMIGKVASLNVSVAAGIALYEVVRQRE